MSDFNNNISNSSGPGSTAEPSMEEILASIRRILKEDDTALPAKADIDDDVLLLDSSMLAKPIDFSTGTEPPEDNTLLAPHPDAAGSPDYEAQHFVSEPTFSVQDYGADDTAPTHDEEPAPPPHEEPVPLHFEAPAPVHYEEPAPIPDEPEPAPIHYQDDPAPAYHDEPVDQAPEPAPAFHAPDEATPPPVTNTEFTPSAHPKPEDSMPENVQPPQGLMSDEASSAAANSIGALVRSISADRSVAVSRGGITIEDIVREEIRPVLKAWLDTHLPSLVERLVRSEIERVIDRGQS